MVNPPQAAPAAAAHWQLLGHSVRGASHALAGRPNQDALALWPPPGAAGMQEPALAIAAVADGHGGARHFRSAQGARLAVEVAQQALRALGEAMAAAGAPDALALAREQVAGLPRRIVGEWVAQARAHLEVHPITPVEWQTLAQEEGEASAATVHDDPLLAYGATLLAALATPHAVVLLQLGDGDVLAVRADGVPLRPLPSDERLGGNLTTSICRPGAEQDFRLKVLPVEAAFPQLLLLSTDGYANSFRTDEDFLKVGPDFLALTARHGAEAVGAQLSTILRDASRDGSGDDITLAMLYRVGAPSAQQGAVPAPAAADEGPAEHVGTQRQLLQAQRQARRWRRATAVLSVALVAALGWHWREPLRTLWQHAPPPELSAQPERQPAHGTPASAPSLPPDRGTPIAAPAAEASASALAEIGHVRARRLEIGIEVRFALDGSVGRAACMARASVWGPGGGNALAQGHARLDPAEPGRRTQEVTVLVPYPADKAKARALQQAAHSVSLRIECDKQLLAKTERLPIEG